MTPIGRTMDSEDRISDFGDLVQKIGQRPRVKFFTDFYRQPTAFYIVAATTGSAFAPQRSATARSLSALRAASTTLAPRRENSSARAAPMPALAPVITTTLLLKSTCMGGTLAVQWVGLKGDRPAVAGS